MEILEPENLEAGKPFKVDLTDKEMQALIVKGIRTLIDESEFKIEVIASKEFSKGAIKYELSEEEEEVLINIGFTQILREHIDNYKKENEENG